MHHQYLLQTLAGYLQCCTAVFHLCITLIRGVPGLWSCLHIDVWNPDPRELVAKLSLTVSIISSKTLLFTTTKTCRKVSVKSWGEQEVLQAANLPSREQQSFSKQGCCHGSQVWVTASQGNCTKKSESILLNYSFGHFLKISLLTVM